MKYQPGQEEYLENIGSFIVSKTISSPHLFFRQGVITMISEYPIRSVLLIFESFKILRVERIKSMSKIYLKENILLKKILKFQICNTSLRPVLLIPLIKKGRGIWPVEALAT